MSEKIRILDDITINKIAAGEVVERPASIVKELVENSIDAGASRITIEIESGGKSLIKIIDNGHGIPSSEVSKCFLRHATSKIDAVEDLFKLNTLGFRGEALASISAVSKLEMTTKYKDESIGTNIYLNGGKVVSKEAVGTNTGTIILIKDIFFNTPARKKFLKSDHSETITVSDTVNKLAIGYPNIKFKYINNGKIMLDTPGDGIQNNAIRCVYGREISSNLINIDYKCNLFSVDGFIGNNNIFRSNRNLQHIYINGRFVKSKIILDAISEAYKSIIPINKHAICFINIYVDPAKLDVNIHPAKLEVKFEKEREIYIELREYLKAKLLKNNLIAKYETYNDKIDLRENKSSISHNSSFIGEKTKSEKEHAKNKSFNENKREFKELEPINLSANVSSFTKFEDINSFSSVNSDNKNSYISEDSCEYSKSKQLEIESVKIKNNDLYKNDEENRETAFSLDNYKVCGTVFDTYIILQRDDSMYLMDQHAAHERILFEKYMNSFRKKSIPIQILLDPIILELSNVDMSLVEKNISVFSYFGFDVEIFGLNHILIRGVPNLFGIPQSEKFIIEIIDNINDISGSYDLKYDRFATMACKSAIKANYRIKNIEISALFKQLESCENPYTCPHGRPIMVELTKSEIEKMFKRII
ncbi:DNA mismatch repair endonuclease MutL [Peptacetobacter hominis]|uniref:DNA mismatch repair protein MutL n=1 Tax=Peptacetobacter hominis TaxID=2743610 RepID=A0A544QVJ2_9FIRM|nr:DNA mismatch repair endonuclease MutL [Peptacetobacter hominis]TQQ84712.1 DNA mismatch repair endonuclease MutL [Peptacetobacter hominis]